MAGLAIALLTFYNGAQSDLRAFRTMHANDRILPSQRDAEQKKLQKERYGPSLSWLDRLMRANSDTQRVKLDFRMLSSLMVAGLASGFKSQVSNMLWMKSDEYWHKGLFTRQNPIMEAVVTLDPQFVDAWSTAGWHWAYNIYADIPTKPQYKNMLELVRDRAIRKEQKAAIDTGLDYLKRGSEMNPDKYRLWFEQGWTRAEKAGIYDEETLRLFQMARKQPDAKLVERQEQVAGKTVTKQVQGMDLIGRTIGHLYEKTPYIDKALEHYGKDLLEAKPEELALLNAVGEYWRQYGTDYAEIAAIYKGGDAVVKRQVKQLVPDVERLVKAHDMRNIMGARKNNEGGQPTGAYITIAARYLPAWKLMKAGKIQEAINMMVGVMNADTRYHLTKLPVLEQVLEIRGDAPSAIKERIAASLSYERTSSQDIGLHFLAKLYEMALEREQNPQKKKAYARLAYETWYRSRERDSLDFYARRETFLYEDKYGFKPPQQIIDQIRASRKAGDVKAAPRVPPNVEQYYRSHDEDHAEAKQ